MEEKSLNQPSSGPEEILWEGSPSSIRLFPVYLQGGILALLLISLIVWVNSVGEVKGTLRSILLIVASVVLAADFLYIFLKWLMLKTRRFKITTERIRVSTGILSKTTNDLELYRVVDMVLVEPFWMRILKLGHLKIISSDRTNPTMLLEALPKAGELQNRLRPAVERCRDRKRVRLMDIDQEDFPPSS